VAAALALLTVVAAVVWLTGIGGGGGAPAAGAAGAGPSGTVASITTGATPSDSNPAPASTTAGPTTRAATPSSARTTAKVAPATPATTVKAAAGQHLITIVNNDDETIWAATNPNAQHPIPVTGWKLDPGQSVTFAVPAGWGGRVWGRTGCSFNAAGVGHCQTGDCGGVFQCKGTGATPATLAELTLDSFDGLDFYDVSLVDGSNLPMYINTTHRVGTDPVSTNGCYQGTCTTAIQCPSAMQVKVGGQAVACTTACQAFGGDAYCCQGAWAGRQNCNPAKWPVDYAKLVYKDAEPYAYSYAFDDSATMACKGGCYYKITFGITP
jgi:hypothetical protein